MFIALQVKEEEEHARFLHTSSQKHHPNGYAGASTSSGSSVASAVAAGLAISSGGTPSHHRSIPAKAPQVCATVVLTNSCTTLLCLLAPASQGYRIRSSTIHHTAQNQVDLFIQATLPFLLRPVLEKVLD